MRNIILAVLALAGALISLPASAQYRAAPQYREAPCGTLPFGRPHGNVAGTAGFAPPCDPHKHQQQRVRLPYPGGIILEPRRLGAHAVSLGRPIYIGRQQGYQQQGHRQQSRRSGSRNSRQHVRKQWTRTVHVEGKTTHCCANNVPDGWDVR